jgi:hypothetical protein
MSFSGRLYFNNKHHRIVYTVDQAAHKVVIYAVGEREDMKVYRDVFKRIT